MFIYRRTIRVQDTDVTGAVYFANELQMGLEAFEELLLYKGFSLQLMKEKVLFPIVHTEADFTAPLFVGDQIELQLTFPEIGNKSFTHQSLLIHKGRQMGQVQIVHAVYAPSRQQTVPIPDDIRIIFEGHTHD